MYFEKLKWQLTQAFMNVWHKLTGEIQDHLFQAWLFKMVLRVVLDTAAQGFSESLIQTVLFVMFGQLKIVCAKIVAPPLIRMSVLHVQYAMLFFPMLVQDMINGNCFKQ